MIIKEYVGFLDNKKQKEVDAPEQPTSTKRKVVKTVAKKKGK